MSRHLMNHEGLAGKSWKGPTQFPTGMLAQMQECDYRVDEHGNASINEEDKEAAIAAGFKDGALPDKNAEPA